MSYKYTTTQSPESSPNQLEKCSPSTDTLTAAPAWPLTDQSMCFFFSQFVVRSETRPDAGWFDFVPHVLQDHGSSVPMNAALKAVSFLSLANRYHRTDIMVDALQLNGRALEAVNEALASPSEAREDGTFAAILLLCLFGVSKYLVTSEVHLADSKAYQWRPETTHWRSRNWYVPATSFAECYRSEQSSRQVVRTSCGRTDGKDLSLLDESLTHESD